MGLEGDFEIFIARIEGKLINLCLSDIPVEGFLDILYAVIDILGVPLGEHLDSAVRRVADISFEPVELCYSEGGESKTDALNSARENDKFGNHFSYCVVRISYCAIEPKQLSNVIVIPGGF